MQWAPSPEREAGRREITGRSRDRVFAYGRYVEILNEGTEPL